MPYSQFYWRIAAGTRSSYALIRLFGLLRYAENLRKSRQGTAVWVEGPAEESG
jgi:hypothetical protein